MQERSKLKCGGKEQKSRPFEYSTLLFQYKGLFQSTQPTKINEDSVKKAGVITAQYIKLSFLGIGGIHAVADWGGGATLPTPSLSTGA